MELSTKGRYAVMALIDLSSNGGEKASVSLADIAKRQSISLSYLEQLFARLRRKGIVAAKRGPNGGYRLAMPPSKIDIATIVFAVDEPLKVTACTPNEKEGCNGRKVKCIAHNLWTALTDHIHDFMVRVTLEDVMLNKINNKTSNNDASLSNVSEAL